MVFDLDAQRSLFYTAAQLRLLMLLACAASAVRTSMTNIKWQAAI
jgi:hypothetical protein